MWNSDQRAGIFWGGWGFFFGSGNGGLFRIKTLNPVYSEILAEITKLNKAILHSTWTGRIWPHLRGTVKKGGKKGIWFIGKKKKKGGSCFIVHHLITSVFSGFEWNFFFIITRKNNSASSCGHLKGALLQYLPMVYGKSKNHVHKLFYCFGKWGGGIKSVALFAQLYNKY